MGYLSRTFISYIIFSCFNSFFRFFSSEEGVASYPIQLPSSKSALDPSIVRVCSFRCSDERTKIMPIFTFISSLYPVIDLFEYLTCYYLLVFIELKASKLEISKGQQNITDLKKINIQQIKRAVAAI